MDDHKNFAYATLAASATSAATSVTVAAGQGALFPTAPFNVTIWPVSVQPLSTNAEIARVTAVNTDTLSITRAQEGTTALSAASGAQIANTITDKVLTDIESAVSGSDVSLIVTLEVFS